MKRLPDERLERYQWIYWFRAEHEEMGGGWARPQTLRHWLFVPDDVSFGGPWAGVYVGMLAVDENESVSATYELPQSYWQEAYGNSLG